MPFIDSIRFPALCLCLTLFITMLIVEGHEANVENYQIRENINWSTPVMPVVIYDIRVNPVYNLERRKIIFNISWSKPPSAETLSYKFKLTPNCSNVHFETSIFENYNSTDILIPPLLNSHQILPSCKYEIKITTVGENGEENDFVDVYTVPECVGSKCSCKFLTPQFTSFVAYEFSPGKLNITWEIENNNNNKTVSRITSKMFEYRSLKTKRLHANPFKKIPIHYNWTSNFLLVNETHFLITNVQYELRATFNNSFNCKISNYTNITMRRIIIEDQPVKDANLHPMLYIVLAVAIFLCAIYILKRNKSFVKELIKDPCSALKGRSRAESRNTYFVVSTGNDRKVDNILYIPEEIIEGNCDRYEFPRSRVSLGKQIGSGAFGQVFLAEVFGMNNLKVNVAVKKLNEGASPEEIDNFLSEIDILKQIGEHPNIVKMFGCCTLKLKEEPYMMIMEYVPCGDLLHYLIDLRDKWKIKIFNSDASSVFSDLSDGAYIIPDNSCSISSSQGQSSIHEKYSSTSNEIRTNDTIRGDLSHTELQEFAFQIASGMEHLEKIPIAHRDLAARNILINEHKTLKISDFGLSRVGPYVNSRTKKMPLRWVSIEAIEDHFYDSKGDVWSFAVVLWEIGTLGAFPYGNIYDTDIPYYLSSGKRLSRPEVCTDELYSLMLKCWSRDPELRPSFNQLVQLLNVKKRRVYVDFSQLNPSYVFPPSQNPYENC